MATMTKSFKHDHHVSKRAAARTFTHFSASEVEGAPEGYVAHPKPLALHWGMPNAGFFPIDLIDVHLVEYPFQKLLALPRTNALVESLVPAADSNTVTIHKKEGPEYIDITRGLQYHHTVGHELLLKFTREFILRVHPPAYDDWKTIVTGGAGDGLNKVADAFLNPGDVILIEEFTFLPFLANVANVGGVLVPLRLNFDRSKELGLDVDYLLNLLANWEQLKPGFRFPKAIYTIPTGQNPTGVTQSLETRRQVYALAEKYDLLIVEDDPYGYLTLPKWHKPASTFKLQEFLEVDEYLAHHLTPLYLTLDHSGRVVRIETFLKLFAPGLRLGFIVAHRRVIDVIEQYANLVTRALSGTLQLIVQNVIAKKFGGVDGWIQWILKMRVTYAHRRDVLLAQIYESAAYKNGWIDVIDPLAGMFASVFINLPEGVDAQAKLRLLNFKFQAFGVGVVPGINMAVDKEFSSKNAAFYRVTFAPANDDLELVEAGRRLVGAVEEFFEKGLEY